jgi:lipopolysaccharide/colanic/teichoic acid biosynthesis glycosyltransferase
MRPGITGLWQISKRMKNASVLDMVSEDMEYVRTYNLLLDVRIILATIPRILEPARRSGRP